MQGASPHSHSQFRPVQSLDLNEEWVTALSPLPSSDTFAYSLGSLFDRFEHSLDRHAPNIGQTPKHVQADG